MEAGGWISYVGNLGFPIVVALFLLLRFEKTLSKLCGAIAVLTLAVVKGDHNTVAEIERMAGHDIYGEKNGHQKFYNPGKGGLD